jgi:hypothetical protein
MAKDLAISHHLDVDPSKITVEGDREARPIRAGFRLAERSAGSSSEEP